MSEPLRHLRWAALLLALLVQVASAAELPLVTLAIGKHRLQAEVAATDESRSLGLMHRRMMPESRGMLFVFTDAARHGMWMMNTHLPLSVAFIDDEGVIINIEDMQPHTRNSHHAARPARYALEMNLGWFAKRGIGPGARIEGLAAAGSPRN